MLESPDSGGDRDREVVRASSRYLGHGMTLAASVALFAWLGSEVGERIGSKSLFTLLGIFLGGAAGFYSMYVQLVVRPRQERESARSERD